MYAKNALVDAQFVDARFAGANTGSPLVGDYSDEAALDTQLATANAGYYTAARLGTMTINDKVFAVRSALDPTGFKPSGANTGDPAFFLNPEPVDAAVEDEDEDEDELEDLTEDEEAAPAADEE